MRQVSFQIVMRIYQKKIHDKTLHVPDTIHFSWKFQVNCIFDLIWAQSHMLQLLTEAKSVYFTLGSRAGWCGCCQDWPNEPIGYTKASTTSVKGYCPFWSTLVCFNSNLTNLLHVKSDYLNCSVWFCPRHMSICTDCLISRLLVHDSVISKKRAAMSSCSW